MQTESLFSLIDRMSIANLKVFHYTKAGNLEAAAIAQGQVNDLGVAGDVYVYECVTGKRKPLLRPHLRVHDHRKIEGKWAGKKEEMEEPKSIMECAWMLASANAQYWDNQSTLQTLKSMIDKSDGLPDKPRLESDFCARQRRQDIFNQRRNDLIDLGDQMFADAVENGR